MTDDGTHSYAWDAEGRLISVDNGSTERHPVLCLVCAPIVMFFGQHKSDPGCSDSGGRLVSARIWCTINRESELRRIRLRKEI